MKPIELAKHIKQGDTFYTPFTDPNGLGATLSLSSWAKCWLPEFLWIGLIIHKKGRKAGLETISHIIETLKDNELAIPQMSKINSLESEKQELFWNIVTEYVEKSVLTPLTVVITPEIGEYFYKSFFDASINIDDCITDLLDITKSCNGFHDELSTDICFIVDWFYIVDERLKILNGVDHIIEALTKYHTLPHGDERILPYEPMIRSAFQGLCNVDCDKEFSAQFWRTLGKISECNGLIIIREEKYICVFYEMAKKVIDYISMTNESKKMETKYLVIMGMTCYIYRIYNQIVEKKLNDNIAGRILYRTMLETYINLKYLLIQEKDIPDIFDRFKAYGIGKYKLVMSKLREQKYVVSEDSQIDEKYMKLIVNEDMNEVFVNMSVGYFDKISVKKKFEACEEVKLYEIHYEYGTNYAHGFWGAIRESSMLICDNPSHAYHAIPDYQGQQMLSSVIFDCESIIRKVFDTISCYVELPDFYLEYVKGLNKDV